MSAHPVDVEGLEEQQDRIEPLEEVDQFIDQTPVNKTAIQQSARVVEASAGQLRTFLTQNPTIPVNSELRLARRQLRPGEYENPTDLLALGTQDIPMVDMGAGGSQNRGNAPADIYQNVRSASERVAVAARKAARATSVKELRKHGLDAQRAAAEARTEARKLINDPTYGPESQETFAKARATYRTVKDFFQKRCRAKMIETVWTDVAGRNITSRSAAGIAGLGTLATVAGLLVWALGFSGARKAYGNFKAQNITVPIGMLPVDVVAKNGLPLIQAVFLLDSNGNQQTSLTVAGVGTWTVTGFQIGFMLDPANTGNSAQVQYVIQGTGGPGLLTDPAYFTVTFDSGQAMPPQPGTAVDLIYPATDRVSKVTFLVASNFQWNGGKAPAGWTDPVGFQVTYTPDSSVTASTIAVTAQYNLGDPTMPANLIVLFPAPPLANVGQAGRTVEVDLPTVGNPPENLTLVANGVAVSSPQDANAADAAGKILKAGQWNASGTKIWLTNLNLPANVNLLQTSYAIVRQGGNAMNPMSAPGAVDSVAGIVTVTFADATAAPVPTPLSRVVANRSNKVTFSVAGAQISAVTGGALDDVNGTWSSDATGVYFQPKTTLAVTSVQVNYTLAGATTSSTITITFLPQPGNFPPPGKPPILQDRTSGQQQLVDPQGLITVPYTVKLWDGANPVDSVNVVEAGITVAQWAISPTTFNQIDFTPSTSPSSVVKLSSNSEPVSYVFEGDQGPLDVSSTPGTVTLSFSTPAAYSANVSQPLLMPAHLISVDQYSVFNAPATKIASAVVYDSSGAEHTTAITVNGLSQGETASVNPHIDLVTGRAVLGITPTVVPGASQHVFPIKYAVKDDQGGKSNQAILTLTLT